MDDLTALTDLAARLSAVRHATDPMQRYRALHDLAPQLKATVAAEMDAAIAAARDTTPEDQVAVDAGVTVHEVRRRVTAHRKRVGPPRTAGRPPKTD